MTTTKTSKICNNKFIEDDGYCAKCGHNHFTEAGGKVYFTTTRTDTDDVKPLPVITTKGLPTQSEEVFEQDAKVDAIESDLGVYDPKTGRTTKATIKASYFIPGNSKPVATITIKSH